MTKQILIELNAVDKATSKIKNVENAVSNLGSKVKKSSDSQTKSYNRSTNAVSQLGKKVKTSSMSQAKSLADVTDTLDSLGNRFRYLSLVAGMAAGAMTLMVKSFVDAAVEAETAAVRLGAYAQISGQGFDRANEIALNFARTGLMSVTEASNTLANLLATGMNLDTAEELMKGMLNTAVLSKEILQDTFGKALEKSSLGIRILQERQVDAIGINFRADQVWRAFGKTIGKTSAQMTTADKQLAIVNFLLKETKKFAGGADVAAGTFGGTLSKLSANVFQTKAALGDTLIPVIGPLVELLIQASNKLREFAKAMPELSMVVIAGSLAVTLLITGLATAGALLPMIAKGAQFSAAALKMLSVTAVLTSLKFIALAIVIGTLIYLIAKATGQWDKWSNSIKGLQKRIADTIKPAQKLNEEIADPKVAKQLAKIQQSIERTTRNFKENMRDWVDKHDKTVRELKSQISDLEREYTKAINKINSNFKDNQEDEALAHRRKVEDIQREIDEEISKGLWADQTKIRNLERELARENEDYSLAQSRNEERREDDLQDTENKYSERLEKLREELEKEEELERKHAERIAEYRTWPLLDQIEKQERQHKERIEQLQEQLNDIKGNAAEQIAANGEVNTSFGELIGATEEVRKHGKWSAEGVKNAWLNAASNIKWFAGEIGKINWYNIGQNIREHLVGAFEWFMDVLTEVDKQFKDFVKWVSDKVRGQGGGAAPSVVQTVSSAAQAGSSFVGGVGSAYGNFIQGLLGISWPEFATGGVVPGPIGQATPAIVHGGETIIPANQSPITVNINNPSVRNNNDIRLIAQQVQEVLSRQTFLRQLK